MKMDSLLGLFTFMLAIATVWLAYETWIGREEQVRQRKEIAFRAALIESANNIVSFTRWNPMLAVNSPPDKEWLNQSLSFTRLNELLETVWVDPMLWERITGGLLVNVKRFEDRIHVNLLDMSIEDRVKIEGSKRDYFLIDLYLKQLACYVLAEMQRQRINIPAAIIRTQMFQPLAWAHGSIEEDPKTTAYTLEVQPLPPFVHFPLEPENVAFRDCRLEVLISKARLALEQPLKLLLSEAKIQKKSVETCS